MKTIKRISLTLLAFLSLLNACDIEQEPYLQDAENEKAILTFVVDSVVGVIDVSASTVTLAFPQGTDVTHLTPYIEVSPYATIQPESGVEQDFTTPVIYTVTAFDGSTQQYQAIAVIADPENEKSILSFNVMDPACEGMINEEEKIITLAFPMGTDLTHLVPVIEVSEGATVDPASGVEQDFSDPVEYTVTAINGTTATYTVTAILVDVPVVETGKTVLIKDFTGSRCVNCPAAAEYAHNLQHQLGEDRIFIMSVHAGSLAQQVGQFPDFVTDEGTAWYGNNASNPLFCVDYVGLTESNTLYVEELDYPVSQSLEEVQSFEIAIHPTYDAATRQLSVVSEIKAIEDMEGEYNVTVCLVEDNIVGWQVIPGGVNQEYVFRNVFRGTLNGADGENIAQGVVTMGDQFSVQSSKTLDAAYNDGECYVWVYVSDKSKNGKVLQTAVKKIK